jgi:hypothetical protein
MQFDRMVIPNLQSPRITIKVFDEENREYVLTKEWNTDNDIYLTLDYLKVMSEVNEETRQEITNYMGNIVNSVMKALENTI